MLNYGQDNLLLKVSEQAFADEAACVSALMEQARWFAPQEGAIRARARRNIEKLRQQQKFSPIESFQQEYGLDSQEGIMLMCLAEALLRIPDDATAKALIHDKISSGEWERHIGEGRPWLVTMGGYGLGLAEKVISHDRMQDTVGEFVGSLVHKLGEPVVRGALKHAMKMMGDAFVVGESIEKAQSAATAWHKKSCLMSYDMLGEGARSMEQAEGHYKNYMEAITAVGSRSGGDIFTRDGVSIKLSALHPRFELRQVETLERELMPRLKELMRAAAKHNIMVTIDAEEASRLDITLIVFKTLFTSAEFKDYHGLGIVVQAYQKRAPYVIDYLRELARQTGKRIPLRLVKGAYWDSEIKRAQIDGLPGYPVFTRKEYTDLSYLACAKKLLGYSREFYPQFATHNARTIASIVEAAGSAEYEFQRLHGMGEALYTEIIKETGRRVRIYAPVGPAHSLLSYLIRRILENGANSSFVHGQYNAPLETLLADPVAYAERAGGVPAENIPLPKQLYGTRSNSLGYDLGNASHLTKWQSAIQAWSKLPAAPKEATLESCKTALASADAAFTSWRNTSVEERAACLEQAADLFAAHEVELVALCMNEAGKTLADGIGEVRETIDYCRYYAYEARRIFAPHVLRGPTGERNVLSLHPRGIIAAISPWNFPLAIFTGQVAAALACGNAVLAKPAAQTPRIAARAVEILHEAGIPKDVLQLLHGSGRTIGGALVDDPRTSGVVFTGSTATGWAISRALAARETAIVPLIAETGGQNCMIVDSSALIEQTVDDMVASAFGSAGQRCSALRVAFVQEDIADELLAILSGAVKALHIGNSSDTATDVSHVIDEASYVNLEKHIASMKSTAKFVAAATLPPQAEARHFVAPHVFEIPHINVLGGEVFGPILHIVRYKASELDNVIAQINGTGFGLTFGIQSRIDEKIDYLCARVTAGNIYVNRSMIGAVVGVQPFGGNGLSGTGPKAGGPHYLPRFCLEQTISTNTAAVGGNLELLA